MPAWPEVRRPTSKPGTSSPPSDHHSRTAHAQGRRGAIRATPRVHAAADYRLDAQGNLVDDEGQIYAHMSEFEDDEDDA